MGLINHILKYRNLTRLISHLEKTPPEKFSMYSYNCEFNGYCIAGHIYFDMLRNTRSGWAPGIVYIQAVQKYLYLDDKSTMDLIYPPDMGSFNLQDAIEMLKNLRKTGKVKWEIT